jgi:hypothetical protein
VRIEEGTVLLATIVVLLLAGVVGFNFADKSTSVIEQPQLPINKVLPGISPIENIRTTSTPAPTDTPAPTELGRWQQFRHPRDAYSFKYPADNLAPAVTDPGDAGSGYVWSAEIGYADGVGSFAAFFTFDGQIEDAINAYYKNNNESKIASIKDVRVNNRVAKIVWRQDIKVPNHHLGRSTIFNTGIRRYSLSWGLALIHYLMK